MNRSMQRLVSVVTAVFMLVTCVFAQGTVVWAGSSGSSSEAKGMYSYTSNEGSNIQEKDMFVYSDEYFQRSSFVQNDGLLTLSAQAAIASASRYGDDEDLYERDATKSGENIQDLLTEMGFQDVAVNKYNGIQPLKQSGACTIGHRTINAFGRNYTLLAVIPRSAGYKEEWAGNFTVGDGDVATGFKAARDEDLRFMKQYIEKNHIKGNLKVWITGHSRGSAVANLLGGFLAGGGAEYLGAEVSLTPQDVYCYGFANPRTVKDGASKAEVFSVEGSRGGEYAEYDTPGEAWSWTKGGKIDVNDRVYTGVRNYPFSYDFITDLPPEEWGYVRFGTDYSISGDGAVADEDMIKELKDVSTFAYKKYVNGGDYRDFETMTFDLWNLETKAKEPGEKTGAEGMTEFVTSMVSGMASLVDTGTYEKSGYQEATCALAGVYGMSVLQFGEEYESGMNDAIKPAILSYLAYTSEKLKKEGKAETDEEAAAIVLKDLLNYAFGEEEIKLDLTVDKCIELIAKTITDDKKKESKLVQELKGIIAGIIPAEDETTIRLAIGSFHPAYNTEGWDNVPTIDVIMAFIEACAYGAKPGTVAYETDSFRNPASVRLLLYLAVTQIPGVSGIIGDGTKSFKQAVSDAMPLLLKGTDDETTYDNFADAADAGLISVLNTSDTAISKKIIKKIRDESMYNELFISDLQDNFDTLCKNNTFKKEEKNISMVRTFLFNFFLNTGETYNMEADIQRIATFIGNIGRIPPAHYNEVFIAWAKAREKAGIGENNSIQHVPAKAPTCIKKGHVEYWTATIAGSQRYFADPELKRTVSKESLVLDVVDHTPAAAVVENEKYTEDGRVERYDSVVYCKVCGEELSREIIVVLTDLSGAEIDVSDATYTGKERKPAPVVTLDGAVLRSGTDYAVTYENNRKVGTATLTIKGIGKYMGTANASFRILPKKTGITSLKAAKVTKKKVTKKGFTVKWKKQKAQTTGYQIQYGTKKNFKSADTVTVKKKTITQKTVTGLKAKTYYVRVRTYKSVDDTNYYSAWSVKKKVRVR